MRFVSKWVLRFVAIVAIVALTIVVGAAVSARSRVPDLKPWHQLVPSAEVHASDVGPTFTLDDYLAREQKVFDEVRTRSRTSSLRKSDSPPIATIGRARPVPRDWNATGTAPSR